MNRRNFLKLGFPATGAILLTPGFFHPKAVKEEIDRQFSGKPSIEEYDIVINGAGLSGYFAAIHAAKQGKNVLIVDKRTSPGYEITAKRKLWLNKEGINQFNSELTQLFFPQDEKQEIHNDSGTGPNGSLFGDELLLFAGSIRKGLLRNLLLNKVHVLLMTDVCGVLSDNEKVQGVLLACKHGLKMVRCKSFVDASDNVLFSRELTGKPYKIEKAGFVLEVEGAGRPRKKEINISKDIPIADQKIQVHQGKHLKDQLFIEFDFPVESQKMEEIEHQSRRLSVQLAKHFSNLDESLSEAQITQFAPECSYYLSNDDLPEPFLDGHYLLKNNPSHLSCSKILNIEAEAKKLINIIQLTKSKTKPSMVFTPGAKIPINQVSFSEPDEPGLAIPLKNCRFDFPGWINNKEQCQVLIAGGGTAGAMAGRGSGEKETNTVIVDYFNDPGGTRTMAGVMGYYHGVREPKIFKQQDEESRRIADNNNLTKRLGHKLYHLQGILNNGGKFLSGSIMCGSLVNDKKVEGILICHNGKLKLIKSEITIDATGDGDIAFFSGAASSHGNSRTGKTQNYSQWDFSRKSESWPNTTTNGDYDIIDNTKISELQRGLFLSHYEARFYDFYPMLGVRESRRIEGLYVLNLIDAVEGTHFNDVISRASSDFDPHYVGSSEYSRCGFLLPHSNKLTTEIPYRSIVPNNLDGLLLSGKNISQTHNAMQFTRMCPDLMVLGYLTGQIASELAQKKIKPRDYNISRLQREWAENGNLQPDYATKKEGNLIHDEEEIARRVKELASGAPEYLYECVRLPKKEVLPLLIKYFNSTDNQKGKLLLAKALAWFGKKQGTDLVEKELKDMFDRELKKGYPGGYVEQYDNIREREKNVLKGLFWRINQNIALLAMAGNQQGEQTIKFILENTTSGGGVVERENKYYNNRIDLKLIPFYNRIFNLCFYAERNPSHAFISGFENLLEDENISGFMTEKYHLTRWRVYRGDLELFIGSAMARCGSKTGYDLLLTYLNDIHYNFKDFALKELKSLTGMDYKYNLQLWKKHLEELTYPRPCKKLKKKIEL
ncbi:MAG: FAD-dependent oxidoreductase [Bacteroidales bacterium]